MRQPNPPNAPKASEFCIISFRIPSGASIIHLYCCHLLILRLTAHHCIMPNREFGAGESSYEEFYPQSTPSLGSASGRQDGQISLHRMPSGSGIAAEDATRAGDEEPLVTSAKPDQASLPDYAVAITKPVSWWSLHAGWTMYGLLLLGVSFAVGHHQYYLSLHGMSADDQTHKLRYGTLLAFLTKASLVASVVAAFRQRFWTALASEPPSLEAIDCLAAAPGDLFAILNRKTLREPKIVILMAWFSW